MTELLMWRILPVLVLGALLMVTASEARADGLPMLRAKGTDLVDPSGRPVLLKGCNLGNYLLPEGWMFRNTLRQAGGGLRDGMALDRTLRRRFGDAKADHLIAQFRRGWITPRDFELIKSFGFNVVRLPFDYRLIQQDVPPYAIKADAFKWLDHAVDMAEAAGLYTILDLHGVPGGQSLADHTGEAGQNRIWTSDVDQQRTVDLWRALATHFKHRTSVAAYDLMNEPYGDKKQDVRPVLKRLMPAIYRAVRDAGDSHVVYFPGAIGNVGIAFYGDPHAQGMTNVAFTEHFYPGRYGSKPAIETHADVLNRQFPLKQAYLANIASPYLVGEFNVIPDSQDPARMMRAYYDRFAEYGWAGTMWSYKLLSTAGGIGPDAWYMATNAGPLPTLDIETCTADELEAFFDSMATTPLAVRESLREALTTPTPRPLYLRQYPTPTPRDGKNAAAASLLANGSFAAAGDGVARDWHTSGGAFARIAGENGAAAVRLDPAVAASALWQDVAVTPGGRYAFGVTARREGNADGDAGGERPVELRLEWTTPAGQVTLNLQKVDVAKLPRDGRTTRWSVRGTAGGDRMRVLILTPEKTANGSGMVVLDDATLAAVSDEP